ncbi:5572_t:CDS:2, partial [Funneliformis caledonium]
KFLNEVSNEAEAIDLLQVTLEQMIKFVMLTTKIALFHIRLIPSQWYYSKELDGSKEPFLVADKFLQENENITSSHNGSVLFLSNFDQTGKDIYEERLGVLEQKLIYGKLHRIYKKALQKALQNNHKTNDLSDLKEVLQDDNTSDKENEDPAMVTLQNLKKRQGKGRLLGIKQFKSSHEDSKPIAKNQPASADESAITNN